jgi:uncharacterized repeat protein (TIGR03803 family)
MKKNYYLIIILLLCGLLCNGQYSVLFNFNGTNGEQPIGNLCIVGNTMYGVTNIGGAYNLGCIFSLDTNGNEYREILDFSGANGAYPEDGVIIIGKSIYGMTHSGGAHDSGCIFMIDTNGTGYMDVWDFGAESNNGAFPWSSLLLVEGKFYGTTQYGGIHDSGCLFSIDTNRTNFKILFSFTTTDGARPFCTLVGSGSYLYGTTVVGGANSDGCIFSIDTNGSNYTKLLDFNWTNGAYPTGSLVLSGNTLYGMTGEGGTPGFGCIFSIQTDGSNYNRLFSFNGYDGNSPSGSLLLEGDRLYGMTSNGGDSATHSYYGNIITVKTDGSGFRQLYVYDSLGTTGKFPEECNLSILDNMLYGMTTFGGTNDSGVVFRIDSNSTAGIFNVNDNNGFIQCYPNPSTGRFTFQISNAEQGISNIEVFDLLGQKVYSSFNIQGSIFDIDLAFQPNGTYFYRVLEEDGCSIGEGKLLIEH